MKIIKKFTLVAGLVLGAINFGFVLEISGGFPKINSEINFENYVFTIESIEKKRIKQIKLTLLN